jgi:hypothetical protein
MSNLIPPTQHTARNRTILMRIALVTSVMAMGGALIIALGFLPAYFNIRAERTTRTLILESIELQEGENGTSERSVVSSMRKRIDVLEKIGSPQKFTSALELVVDERPRDTTIHALAYTHKNGMGTLNITGTAPDSAAIRTYAETLKGNRLFEKVNVPLTALAQTGKGNFTLTITGAF